VAKSPLTVAWISDFPIEWLADIPEKVQALPRRPPATWQMVLLTEFEKNPAIRTHVIVLRGRIAGDFSFERNGTVFHVLKASGKMQAHPPGFGSCLGQREGRGADRLAAALAVCDDHSRLVHLVQAENQTAPI
jgi:hypothetical protein